MKSKTLLIFILLSFFASYGRCEDVTTDAIKEAFIKAEEREGKLLKDYLLVDQDGRKFRLSEYFKGERPLVIGYIFTSCSMVCPNILKSIKENVEKAKKELGDTFDVIVIGFDAENDTPENLKEFGLRYMDDFKTIRFAGSDERTIKALTADAGFFYKKSADGMFDHLDMATVVRKDGTVFKQVFGIRSSGEELVNILREAVKGSPSPAEPKTLIEKIKYFCYKYDASTGSYVLNYPVIIGFFLQAIVIAAIILLVWGKEIKGFFKR